MADRVVCVTTRARGAPVTVWPVPVPMPPARNSGVDIWKLGTSVVVAPLLLCEMIVAAVGVPDEVTLRDGTTVGACRCTYVVVLPPPWVAPCIGGVVMRIGPLMVARLVACRLAATTGVAETRFDTWYDTVVGGMVGGGRETVNEAVWVTVRAPGRVLICVRFVVVASASRWVEGNTF